MTRILFFILIFGITTSSYSQFELNKKFKTIPAKKIPVQPKKTESIDPKDPFAVKPKMTPNAPKKKLEDPTYSNGMKPEPISMIKKNEFINPGDELKEKLEKDLGKTLVREGLKEDDRLLVKIDIKFGEIRTKSDYFIVKYRDFGDIDGDLFRVFFNEDVFADKIFLEYDLNEFKIFLKDGINTMSIQALNKGAIGGNTGEFQIYDSKGKHILTDYWQNLDAGVRANFIIVKEE